MELQNAYRKKSEAQLKRRDDKNIPLESKLENACADIKDKRTGQIQRLLAQRHNASKKMKELGKASDEAWKSGQESDEA
jgi:hypothetical protein